MNFLGHHEVARSVSGDDNPAFLFGSMVPDFVGMARLKRDYKYNNGDDVTDRQLYAGIRFHYKTNDRFDESEPVKELERAMIAGFKKFMPRWTAVQCGRVGKDILFDGYVIKQPMVVESYQNTLGIAASGLIVLTGIAESPEGLLQGVQMMEQLGLPDYADPEVVAHRLYRRLTGTRSEFSPDLLPHLSEAMTEHQATVFEIGSIVMDEVVEKLAA
ncbi:MAG: hypothetical protein V4702_04110 [Patescibacteria group bacterium]